MKISNKMLGILFSILGVLCIFYPVVSSLWIEIFLGAAFFVGAIFALIKFPSAGTFWDKTLFVVLAVLYALGGLFMMMNPVEGSVALMIALGAIFLTEGVFILIYCFKGGNKHPVLMFINGIVTLILGVILLANLDMALWAIGTLAGIDLLFTGVAVIAMPANADIAIEAAIPNPIPPSSK